MKLSAGTSRTFVKARLQPLTQIFIPVIALLFASSNCSGGVGDEYILRIHAASFLFRTARGPSGEMDIINQGGLHVYRFTVTSTTGAITTDTFYFKDLLAARSYTDINSDGNATLTIEYGAAGTSRGEITLHRLGGVKRGTYTITGSPIGSASGEFSVLEFAGLLKQVDGLGNYSGTLYNTGGQSDEPRTIVIGPAKNDDSIGLYPARNYHVSIYESTGNASLDDSGSSLYPYQQILGHVSKAGSGLSSIAGNLLIESSDNVQGPWVPLISVDVPRVFTNQFYRMQLRSGP